MKNRFNLLYKPEETWAKLQERHFTIPQVYLRFFLFMAAIPVVSAFIGTVYIGWSVGNEEPTKLTSESALMLSISAYIAILVGTYIFAHFVHWMAKTYKSDASLADCFALVAYSCVPLLLVSIVSVYPILWLDTIFTLIGGAFSLRLLFIGTPIMMKINQERAFLFTNSILTVAMVLTVGVIAMTVLFWGAGISPEFTK